MSNIKKKNKKWKNTENKISRNHINQAWYKKLKQTQIWLFSSFVVFDLPHKAYSTKEKRNNVIDKSSHHSTEYEWYVNIEIKILDVLMTID